MKNENQYNTNNYIDPHDFWMLVETEILNYLKSLSSHYIVEQAKNEGWLGSMHSRKDFFGLLGYLRNNFACQIKILYKFSNHVPIFWGEFDSFFQSDFFKNAVLKNGAVSFRLHPTIIDNQPINYLDIVKAKSHIASSKNSI